MCKICGFTRCQVCNDPAPFIVMTPGEKHGACRTHVDSIRTSMTIRTGSAPTIIDRADLVSEGRA